MDEDGEDNEDGVHRRTTRTGSTEWTMVGGMSRMAQAASPYRLKVILIRTPGSNEVGALPVEVGNAGEVYLTGVCSADENWMAGAHA